MDVWKLGRISKRELKANPLQPPSWLKCYRWISKRELKELNEAQNSIFLTAKNLKKRIEREGWCRRASDGLHDRESQKENWKLIHYNRQRSRRTRIRESQKENWKREDVGDYGCGGDRENLKKRIESYEVLAASLLDEAGISKRELKDLMALLFPLFHRAWISKRELKELGLTDRVRRIDMRISKRELKGVGVKGGGRTWA